MISKWQNLKIDCMALLFIGTRVQMPLSPDPSPSVLCELPNHLPCPSWAHTRGLGTGLDSGSDPLNSPKADSWETTGKTHAPRVLIGGLDVCGVPELLQYRKLPHACHGWWLLVVLPAWLFLLTPLCAAGVPSYLITQVRKVKLGG
jgi:hypothetical protein